LHSPFPRWGIFYANDERGDKESTTSANLFFLRTASLYRAQLGARLGPAALKALEL